MLNNSQFSGLNSMLNGKRVFVRDYIPEDSFTESLHINDPELIILDPPVSHSPVITSFSIITLEGVHIGSTCAYNYYYSPNDVEIGIRIWDRNYWDKGYGEEVINLLCDWVFNVSKVDRIVLKTVNTNIRAQKCYMKCGFEVFGAQIIDGFNMIWMKRERMQLLSKGDS